MKKILITYHLLLITCGAFAACPTNYINSQGFSLVEGACPSGSVPTGFTVNDTVCASGSVSTSSYLPDGGSFTDSKGIYGYSCTIP